MHWLSAYSFSIGADYTRDFKCSCQGLMLGERVGCTSKCVCGCMLIYCELFLSCFAVGNPPEVVHFRYTFYLLMKTHMYVHWNMVGRQL